MRLGLVFSLSLLLAGCFQPLYGTQSPIGGKAGVGDKMSAVEVAPIAAPNGSRLARVGVNAAVAILAALRQRDTTGQGTHVTTSLFECGISMLSYFATSLFAEHAAGVQTGLAPEASASITVPNQAFRCSNGWRQTCPSGSQPAARGPIPTRAAPISGDWVN